jgi:Kinesin motor domain
MSTIDPTSNKVRVCVRSRPLTIREARGRRCLSIINDRINIGDKSFFYDSVFDEYSTQADIYDTCIARLIEGCFQGFNATVFAYGQTGSGKTHTMIGNSDEDEVGVIQRALMQIFSTLQEKKTANDSENARVISNVHVSFIEIYNDECKDLLHPDISSREIIIREDKDGKIFLTGAREEAVSSAEEAMMFLERGSMSRTTAETLMNNSSSRSHVSYYMLLLLLLLSFLLLICCLVCH